MSSQSLEVALSARDLNVDSETVVGGRSAADSNGLKIALRIARNKLITNSMFGYPDRLLAERTKAVMINCDELPRAKSYAINAERAWKLHSRQGN